VSETNQSGISENGIAALSYITFVPAIFFLLLPRYNRSAYVRFHAWQSILLNITVFLLSVILTYLAAPLMMSGAMFFLALTRILWAIWLGIWIVCAVAALNGKHLEIPLLGPLADKQANPRT